MDLETEIRNFVQEIEGTLKKVEADANKLAQQIETEANRRSREAEPEIKRAMADTIRKTITELEKIERRLRQ
ncbi:MAG TPA: hypothetical protein VLV31_13615 [Candidatus Acidoferrales bacterium]|nr:hypothetical protein [Candidatus Acidoferrales bacterium]